MILGSTQKRLEIIQIRIQLSQGLMRKPAGLQFNNYMTLQHPVIKHKVHKEVFITDQDPFLPGLKTEPVPKFKKE